MKPKYKRILLKLSGESLAGPDKHGINFDTVLKICEPIRKCNEKGVQIGIVVGGGNFWRGRSSGEMDRPRADHMGMLATAINALGVCDALEQLGVPCRVQTAISMPQFAEPYIRNKAIRHLEKGRVVVFGCGTGNPFFSTDTAASLRAAEIEADIIFKATMVDGVYDSDPKLKTSTSWTAPLPHCARTTTSRFSYSASKNPTTSTRRSAVRASARLCPTTNGISFVNI